MSLTKYENGVAIVRRLRTTDLEGKIKVATVFSSDRVSHSGPVEYEADVRFVIVKKYAKHTSRKYGDSKKTKVLTASINLGVLMMEAVITCKTSVNFYQTTRRNIPEDSYLHTLRRENLKSHHVQYISPKRWYILRSPHGVAIQQANIGMVNTVATHGPQPVDRTKLLCCVKKVL
jgi:hypothetical protein